MIRIRLSGPGKNALGSSLMAEVLEQVEAADGAPLLFEGDGDAFSAGLDLKEVGGLDADGMVDFLTRLQHFFRTIWLYPGPTAAAVNGHAIAGGCILAMCCDVAIATDNERARIGLNEVAIGLRFPPSLLRFVRANIAADHIDEVVLGAGLHSPSEAARLGLVHGIATDPVAEASARLGKLSRHPSGAYAATKRDLRQGIMETTEEEQRQFDEQVVPFWTSPELKAKISALLGG
jgi:enoyl-CoA hydratase/carnithine racemase